MQTLTTEARNRIFALKYGAHILEGGEYNFPGMKCFEGKSFFWDFELKYHRDYDWTFSLIKVIEGMGGEIVPYSDYVMAKFNNGSSGLMLPYARYQSFPDPKLETINCACAWFFENN